MKLGLGIKHELKVQKTGRNVQYVKYIFNAHISYIEFCESL